MVVAVVGGWGGRGEGGHILAGVFVLKHDGVQTKCDAVALFYFKSAITVEGARGRDGGWVGVCRITTEANGRNVTTLDWAKLAKR